MNITFLILGLITGLLLGTVLEKRKCQKKVNKIYCDIFKGEKWKHFGSV